MNFLLNHVSGCIPSSFSDDHFGAQLIELIPQLFRFQMTLDLLHFAAVAFGLQLFGPWIRRGGAFVRLR